MKYQRIGLVSKAIYARYGDMSHIKLTQTQWCQAIELLATSHRVMLEQTFGLLPNTEPQTVRALAKTRGKKSSPALVSAELNEALKKLYDQLHR